MNSTAAVAELAQRVRENGEKLIAVIYRGVILATVAMLLRNSFLLAILAWPALVSSSIPMALMVIASLLFTWRSLHRDFQNSEALNLQLEQPFSLPAALKFGLVFLRLHVAGSLAQRYLGTFGFYAVSVVGGLLSSASAVAAAGTAAAHNEVTIQTAANGAVLASITSTLVDIPLVARFGSQRPLKLRLSVALCAIAGIGIAGIIVHDVLRF